MSFDGRALRNALGQFATGVTVITTNPEGHEPLGMTVNSFSAVSLDPPLVLWSLQKDSECFDAFSAATHYGVNVLEQSQMDLSNRFAKKGQHGINPSEYRQGRSGCIVLRGAMMSLECRIEARHDAGDHIILVGRVEDMEQRPNRKPLVFFGGRYRELK
jgi:flavin reductase (DIM6/NTAB) family NADH-FMN oxidoreductase RutF